MVCHPKTAHFTLAGIWEISCNAPASSRASISSSVAFPLIIFKKLSASFTASSFFLPMIRSNMISADAWEMAQPSPTKPPSLMMPSSTFNFNQMWSPQLGFKPSSTRLASGISSLWTGCRLWSVKISTLHNPFSFLLSSCFLQKHRSLLLYCRRKGWLLW